MFGNYRPAAFPSMQVLHWRDVRDRVAALNPVLAAVVDELDPGDDCRVYHCRYPYGSEIVKQGLFFLPNTAGQLLPITDPLWSEQIRNDLSYNLQANPACMVLSKALEYSFHEHENRGFLYETIKPGQLFGTQQVLDEAQWSFHPPFVWDLTAGARSIFLLAKVADAIGNDRLRKYFRVMAPRPDILAEHWAMFQQLGNCADLNPNPWVCDVLFFNRRWFERFDDPAWRELHRYLLREAWQKTAYRRNQVFWEGVYGLVQAKHPKMSAYISEIVRYLLTIAIGVQPAFAPAVDEELAPIAAIQRAYADFYRLRSYWPIIMQPSYFQWQEEHPQPVYYSFQFSAMMNLVPKNVAAASASSEMFDVQSLLAFYLEHLNSAAFRLQGSQLDQALQHTRFDFIHTSLKNNKHVLNFEQVLADDPRLSKTLYPPFRNSTFPEDASFLRGCVRVAKK